MDEHLSPDYVKSLETKFRSDAKNLVAMNAVTSQGYQAVGLDRSFVTEAHHTFSHQIRTPKATNQKQTGRCWAFAGLNLLRLDALKSLNVEEFELSQNFMMFYDKLEKSNYFLSSIADTVDEPVDSRLSTWLLENPISDAGQWNMLVSLIDRYGVVPKSVMPETWSSSNSSSMNGVLAERLRHGAARIRQARERIDAIRAEVLEEIYRILAIHLGLPPQEFLWEWRDRNGEFHRDGLITPREFYSKHVGRDLDEYVCVIHAPTSDKPFGKCYTVDYLQNMVDGRIIRYVNLELEEMKKAAVDSVVAGEPVWFGSDTGKMFEREKGILAPEAFTYDIVFGYEDGLDKGGRLDFRHGRVTHAMIITGVDLDDSGKPLRWRVENSGGDEMGDKGSLVMSDRWFDEYVYQITVASRFLAPASAALADEEPVRLPPWDPIGALAL